MYYNFIILVSYISKVAKLWLASRMLIHFKLDSQVAWPPLLYIDDID